MENSYWKKTITERTRTYRASDIAELLGLSLTAAYELMHNTEFPSFRVGTRLLIAKEDFEEWLTEQKEKTV